MTRHTWLLEPVADDDDAGWCSHGSEGRRAAQFHATHQAAASDTLKCALPRFRGFS
jgi:hypothetical protein